MIFCWGLLIITTICGIFKLSVNGVSKSLIIFYFIVQELLGSLFILIYINHIIVYLLLLKSGVAPFHFWLSKILIGCFGYSFIWILTIQKLPYFFIIIILYSYISLFLIVFGLIFPLLQCLFIKEIHIIIFLLLTSRRNGLLLFGCLNFLIGFLFFIIYILIIYIFFGMNYKSGLIFISIELFFLLIGFPGRLPFFIKVIMFFSLFNGSGLLIIFILIFFTLNLVSCLIVILHINIQTMSNKVLFVFFYFLFLVLLL